MKKNLILCLVFLILTAIFTACGNSSSSAEYKDGSYKAIAQGPDEHGWTDFVEITIKDGKISEIEYDAVNDDNMLKSEDEEYKAAMESAGSETYPSKFTKELEDDLLEKQDISKVEVVAGATTASNSFKKLTDKLLSENAISGSTEVLTVE